MDGGERDGQAESFSVSGRRGASEINRNTTGAAANYELHIQKLKNHFEAQRNNTLELYKFFIIDWPTEVPFADFETKCRGQWLHCEFPITIESAIITLAAVKTKNEKLHSELIRKNGVVKSVRETAKAFEMAQQGIETMAGDNSTAQGGEQQRIATR